MVSNKSARTLVGVLRSALNISAWLESMTGGFPLFVVAIAFLFGFYMGVWYRCWRHLALVEGRPLHLSGLVQGFTEVFNPSISLFIFSCNKAVSFAFYGGRVFCIITTKTFGDVIDREVIVTCCGTLSVCWWPLYKGPLVKPGTLFHFVVFVLVCFLDLLLEPWRFGTQYLDFELFPSLIIVYFLLLEAQDFGCYVQHRFSWWCSTCWLFRRQTPLMCLRMHWSGFSAPK